jgi:hypothetical protein
LVWHPLSNNTMSTYSHLLLRSRRLHPVTIIVEVFFIAQPSDRKLLQETLKFSKLSLKSLRCCSKYLAVYLVPNLIPTDSDGPQCGVYSSAAPSSYGPSARPRDHAAKSFLLLTASQRKPIKNHQRRETPNVRDILSASNPSSHITGLCITSDCSIADRNPCPPSAFGRPHLLRDTRPTRRTPVIRSTRYQINDRHIRQLVTDEIPSDS